MEDEEKFFLVVGLGNPGTSYEKTRHNAGFSVVQSFAKKHSLSFKHSSHLIGEIAQGRLKEKKMLLLLPTTFMNSSGDAVRRCMDYYQVPIDHMMVVCDDIALPLGSARMRSKGSAGGHNGLKSIEAHLRTIHYARLKMGVGLEPNEDLSDYVLGKFSKPEWEELEKATLKAIEALEVWLLLGIAAAMQFSNAKIERKEGESNV